jgi:hypothetical protein
MSGRIYARSCFVAAASLLALAFCVAADAPKEKTGPKDAGFAAMEGLVGTWVATEAPKAGEKPGTIVFKLVSGGSALMESMLPGTDREMVNMYTADDKGVVMTHYCAMGNQPRLRLASIEKGVLKFEFVDGGNLKSRDSMHMDSLEITINGDHLTEKWASYSDGKVGAIHSFELIRQK